MQNDYVQTSYNQRRSKVRRRPVQEASLALSRSNLRSFRRKCTVLKEVLVTLLGLFGGPAMIRRPHSDSAPGELRPPCPLRYDPAYNTRLY